MACHRLMIPPVATLVAVLVGWALPALADQAAGARCAGTLAPPAAAIYRATAPDIRKDTVIADALRARVRPMVMSGQLDRAAAQSAAPAAGACLKLLRD